MTARDECRRVHVEPNQLQQKQKMERIFESQKNIRGTPITLIILAHDDHLTTTALASTSDRIKRKAKKPRAQKPTRRINLHLLESDLGEFVMLYACMMYQY